MARARFVSITVVGAGAALLASIAACVIDLDPPLTGAVDGSAPVDAADSATSDVVSSDDASAAEAGFDADAQVVAPECVVATDCPPPSGPAAACVVPSCSSGACVYDVCPTDAGACMISRCDVEAGACGAPEPQSYVSAITLPLDTDVGAQFGQASTGVLCTEASRCLMLVYPYVFFAENDPMVTTPLKALNVAIPALTPTPIALPGLELVGPGDVFQLVRSGSRLYLVTRVFAAGVTTSAHVTIAWVDVPKDPTIMSLTAQTAQISFTTAPSTILGLPAPNEGLFLVANNTQVAVTGPENVDAAASFVTVSLESNVAPVAATGNNALYFVPSTTVATANLATNLGATGSRAGTVTTLTPAGAGEHYTTTSATSFAFGTSDNGAVVQAAPYGLPDGSVSVIARVKLAWLLDNASDRAIDPTSVEIFGWPDGGIASQRVALSALARDDVNAFAFGYDPILKAGVVTLVTRSASGTVDGGVAVDGGLVLRADDARRFTVQYPFAASSAVSRYALFSDSRHSFLIGAEPADGGAGPDLGVYTLSPSCAIDAGN